MNNHQSPRNHHVLSQSSPFKMSVKDDSSRTPIHIRPLSAADVPQIVPLLSENYKTQDFRKAFFKHIIRQPAPLLGLILFGAIAFFSWGNFTLAVLSPVILYVYLAALYHFRVDSILAQVPDLRDPMSFYSQSEDDRFWVAVSGSEVAGSVAVKSNANGIAEIKRMQVSPRFQGIGLSKKLLQTAIDHCTESASLTKIVLSTTAMQIPAQKLYEKYGFHETRIEKRLVGPLKIATMDLIHYERVLPPK